MGCTVADRRGRRLPRAAAVIVALLGVASSAAAVPQTREAVKVLPRGDVFRPLLADTKQPQFQAGHVWVWSDVRDTRLGAAAFGENFGVVRWSGAGPRDGLQINIAGGVFAQFDLESESNDLVNADYIIGIPVTYRRRDFSVRFRIYHQSSHLGDEFLLRVRPQRVNLSFEATELLLSGTAGPWRAYGGGEYIFRREPAALDPEILRGGLEFRPPGAVLRFGELGSGRYVAGLDVKWWSHHDRPGWSAKSGLEFSPPHDSDGTARRWSVLLLFYDGPTPFGQFFPEQVTYLDLELRFSL